MAGLEEAKVTTLPSPRHGPNPSWTELIMSRIIRDPSTAPSIEL